MKDKDSCCGDGCCGSGMSWLPLLVIVAVMVGGFYIISVALPHGGAPVNIYSNGTATPEHYTISTSGTATDKVEPDMLTVSFQVQNEASTAKDAQSSNAEKSVAIIAALKALGLQDKDIQTAYYSVDVKKESHYICKNTTSQSDCYYTYTDAGYTATHSFNVDVYVLDKGGDVVDAIVAAGGDVNSISFGLKPETRQAETQRLLAAASADAKARATAIANGAGVVITKPLSLSESSGYSPVYYNKYAMMDAAVATAGTNLQGGTIDVSTTVSATYDTR